MAADDDTMDEEGRETGGEDCSEASPVGPSDAWGPGGNTDRGTIALINRAIRARWAIPDVLRQQIPAMLGRIALNGEERSQVMASRVLAYMDGLNLHQEKRDTGEDRIRAVVHLSTEDIREAARLLAGKSPPEPPQIGSVAPDQPDTEIVDSAAISGHPTPSSGH
jgi:hypothetical protein